MQRNVLLKGIRNYPVFLANFEVKHVLSLVEDLRVVFENLNVT